MSLKEYLPAQIDEVVDAAYGAADFWAASDADSRAVLLRTLADRLEAQRDAFVAIAAAETSLGVARLNGELARTAFQLRGFAEEVERGTPFAVIDDPAIVSAPPQGRPRLMRVRVPLGPVAMFSASNFPFAFSVLGGDTASALAAGCPVVVKAHPGHPELSRHVHALAQTALGGLDLPLGLIGMVEGGTPAVGIHLIRHPRIAAAAFTGSVRGGLALQAEAQRRQRPIPFYGELGSINPFVVLPAALEQPIQPMAQMLAQSIGMGCGQFCTSPGLIVVQRSEGAQRFEAALTEELLQMTPHAMLNAGIRRAYAASIDARARDSRLQVLAHSRRAETEPPAPFLARVDARSFVSFHDLHEEIFGPAALFVVADSLDEIVDVLEAVGGSLTVTIWGVGEGTPAIQPLVRQAMKTAGRVLFAGVPTGVAVSAAQHHGGPFPSSTVPSATSVGYSAMDRFLRPVALQDPPAWLGERAGRPL